VLLKISLLNKDTNFISTLHSVQSNISIGIETFIIFLVILLILNKENKMIAVIFEVQIATSKQGQYLSLASQLRPLLNNIDGFISIERFQSLATEGKLLSLSWWKNEDAILQWKNNILHSKAQQEGKKSIFDFYKISIVKLERCYEFTSSHT